MVQHCADVKIVSGGGPDLSVGAEFQWRTFGGHLQSHVLIFDFPRELGWDAVGKLRAYHGWRLESDRVGCRVVTEGLRTASCHACSAGTCGENAAGPSALA